MHSVSPRKVEKTASFYNFGAKHSKVRKVNQSFCTKSTKEEKKKREKNIKSDLLEFYNCEKKKAEKYISVPSGYQHDWNTSAHQRSSNLPSESFQAFKKVILTKPITLKRPCTGIPPNTTSVKFLQNNLDTRKILIKDLGLELTDDESENSDSDSKNLVTRKVQMKDLHLELTDDESDDSDSVLKLSENQLNQDAASSSSNSLVFPHSSNSCTQQPPNYCKQNPLNGYTQNPPNGCIQNPPNGYTKNPSNGCIQNPLNGTHNLNINKKRNPTKNDDIMFLFNPYYSAIEQKKLNVQRKKLHGNHEDKPSTSTSTAESKRAKVRQNDLKKTQWRRERQISPKMRKIHAELFDMLKDDNSSSDTPAVRQPPVLPPGSAIPVWDAYTSMPEPLPEQLAEIDLSLDNEDELREKYRHLKHPFDNGYTIPELELSIQQARQLQLALGTQLESELNEWLILKRHMIVTRKK